MISHLLPCLVFLAGVIAGWAMTCRDNGRKAKEIKALRFDLRAWKNAAVYWQERAGFRILPVSRIIRQKPLSERLKMVNEAEIKAAREAWGDQVQAEELILEIDQDREDPR